MAGLKNTNKMKIHLNSFQGGEATDFKYGTASSFYSSQGLDFRSKISQMSVLPGFYNLQSNLSDRIDAMIQTPNGVRYGVGNAGYLYRVNTSNTISTIGKLNSNGAAGMAYNQISDQIYIPSQQTVSLYGQIVAGSPSLKLDNFGPSASVASGVIYIWDTATLSYDGNTDSNTGLTTARNNLNVLTTQGITPSNYASLVTNTLTNTYTLPTAISETYNNVCPFVPDISPFHSVAVWVSTIGSGNYTLTMHDSLNNNLGSVTIAHASIVLGWNLFVFAAPGINALPTTIANGTQQGYHFHLTSSSSNDTAAVYTIAQNNLQGCNMVLFAYRLVKTNNGWHPTTIFNGTSGPLLCIGNGPYLSTYNFAWDVDPSNFQWVRHALFLDSGYEVCGLSVNNQYLVIAAEKRSTNSNKSYQDGYLYFWDGSNPTYNFKIEIPMGSPYSLATVNNITYFYCAGSLFAWGGGQQVIKVRYMAYQNTDYLGVVDHTIVNPNMIDSRYNLLMLGYPSTTTNINIPFGIYSWGAVELIYPNSFGYSYSLANQQQNYSSSNNLQIGMIKNFVDQMYMSWSYTSGGVTQYGLDTVDNTSTPAQNFSWQSLIWDGGVRYKRKEAMRFKVNFLPLPANTTITLEYQLDRSGTWISADPTTEVPYTASVGQTSVTVELNNARFYEAQWGFFGTCTSSATAPTITGVTFELDPLTDEVDIRSDYT